MLPESQQNDKTTTDPQSTRPNPKPRWFHLTPNRVEIVGIAVVFGLIGLLCFAGHQFAIHMEMSFAAPMLFISTAPGTGNQAHFVTEGFQDRGLSLFVLSRVASEDKPILVGHLEWGAIVVFDSAVWSQDGSVIACRTRTPSNTVAYSYVYDFAQNESLMPERMSPRSIGDLGSPIDWHTHSMRIEKLIMLRGGVGQEVTRHDIEEASKEMNWLQWQAYKPK